MHEVLARAGMVSPGLHPQTIARLRSRRRLYHPSTMRIDQLLENSGPVFSIEFFPPKTPEGVDGLFETVEALKPLEPDFVSVTYGAGGATRDGTVEIATRIKREHGLEAMAHLSCVGETREGLVEILDRFADAGIENVLALRGDPPRGEAEFRAPAGGLSSAAELAGFISERYSFAIGGACFPEVHPEAPSLEADLAYLRTKVAAGARFLITQLFFDNRVYFKFVEAARDAGIEVPIIPGVIPITSYAQVSRICDLCDASIPPELSAAMDGLGGDLEAETLLGVAYAAQQCEELLARGAPGIHFYALNRAPGTRAVLSALRASRPWERAGGGSASTPVSVE
jgi:methylenetetrahydrofolate reductase (NADPH)